MTNQIVIPTNPADQKTILDAVKEADDCMLRIESERSQIKAIIEMLSEKFPDLDKKYFRKMIRTYHKNNFDNEVSETSDFQTLYETIVK